MIFLRVFAAAVQTRKRARAPRCARHISRQTPCPLAASRASAGERLLFIASFFLCVSAGRCGAPSTSLRAVVGGRRLPRRMSQTWAVLAGIEFAVLAVVTAWLVRFFAIPGSPRLALVTVFVSWCVRARARRRRATAAAPTRLRAARPLPPRAYAPMPRARPLRRHPFSFALQVLGLLRHALSAH